MELTFWLVNDLNKALKMWTPTVWLDGIWMVDDKLELKNGIVFRKPTAFDIEREWNLLSPPFIMGEIDGWTIGEPSAILELSRRAKSQPEIHEELERLIMTLRLFRLGSVFIIKTYWKSESVIDLHGRSWRSHRMYSPHKYPLSISDFPKLENFIQTIAPLLPHNSGSTDYIAIAIQRYNDAILKPEIIESKISFAIMSLEALFLKEKEREELERRLSQRIAKVLNNFGKQALEICNTPTRAYDLRSGFVHGSPILKESLGEASKLAEKVIEYNRLSIVIWLLLKSKSEFDKDKFLNLIDNSLLNEDANKKLAEILKESCRDILEPN